MSGYLVGPDAFLYGANLGGADLTGADLFGANIEGAVLTGATLTDANLENVDAMAVLLSNSNLAGTNLAGANLVDVTSGGITGTPATLPKTTPTNWQFVDGYLVGPYANLTGADLAGQYLASGNLDGANLTDSDLSDSDLTNAYVTDAVMTGTNLADATLAGITSHNVVGTPAALPSGWELVGGILKPIPPAPGAGSTTKISSAQAAPQVAAAPKAETASKVTAAPRATTPRTTTSLQLGIDVYTTDNCEPASVWQANATNEMKGIKSLGANTVQIVFPFYTTAPNASTLFSADLCGEPEANPVPLQSPSPARLAVLVHAGQAAGLHVMLRPLLDQSNIYIFGDWRGNIKPTNKSAWMTSYEAVLKPYLEMAQANKVTRFAISSELTSLSSSLQWPSVIASAKKLYSGQLTFDSSWVAPLAGAVHAGTAVAQDAYPDIPHSSATTTVAQLLAGWNTYLKAEPLAAPAASDVFEEVGITAIDGTYAKPNIAPPPGGTFNQAIQANWFTAACEFVKQHKIGGVYFWGPQFYYNFGNLITKPDPGQASELQPASQTAIRKCFA
ncbi:MAG: pentapeptide repeat-containing protein [Acidimicrobiales bacterium]